MELYLVFKLIWWLLLGVLLIALAVMVGMDMGVVTLLRFVGRSDMERRVTLNAIGPHWEGNQVWFVLGGGAIFAAFPLIYATAFSGLYIVMLLLLWTMIVRPLGFEYRGKIQSETWRSVWDWALTVSGLVPMVIYGAAFGNILLGLPFHFSWNLTSYYTGSFLSLFNPFAILCGLMSLSLAVFMGGVVLTGRTEGVVQARARRAAKLAVGVALALFTVGGVWVARMSGYHLLQSAAPGVAQSPLHQTVTVAAGAWWDNFHAAPVLWLVPVLAYAGMVLGWFALRGGRATLAWWLGALAWVGVIGTVGASMFPFLMPSSLEPSQSLTIWNSISSLRTLIWMTGFAAVFVPLIMAYTSWAFYVMRGKVTEQKIASDEHAY